MIRTGMRLGSKSSLFTSVVAVEESFAGSGVGDSDVCATKLKAQQQSQAIIRSTRASRGAIPRGSLRMWTWKSSSGMLFSRPANAFAAGPLPSCQRPAPIPCVGDEILSFRESNRQRKQRGQTSVSPLLSAGFVSESTCGFLLSELLSQMSVYFFVIDRSTN